MFRRFGKNEEGTATVEFVIALLPIFTIFMSSFEAAYLTARYIMLDRAMDIVIRDIRLTTGISKTKEQIRDALCTHSLHLIPDCSNAVTIETTEINPPSWNLPDTNIPCVDRMTPDPPVTSYTQAGPNKLVLVRACAVVDPWFPLTGLGLALTKDASGGYSMYAVSAYVAEP